MSELPRPLEAWSSALGLFPRHLALELGTWLPRLSIALGPLSSHAIFGHDQPDGFDGLSRRGPYERLLAAEWALADEYPDEFNRRAVNGEHAFLRLAFRAPAGRRRCLALLDSGPSQLGAPRLAQLAALVVLERRAFDASTELQWAVLQQPPGELLSGVTRASVEHWMRARSPHEPTAADLDGWRAVFGDGADDEVWVLGGPHTARFEGASLLTVREAGAALSVELRPRHASAARREVSLPLPSDEVCTQLIRSPLRREAPLSKGLRPSTNFVFVAGGSRLLYGTRAGLFTHLIPGSPGFAAPSTQWHVPKDEEPVAAGWDKGLLLVTMRGSSTQPSRELRVCWFNKRGGLRGQGAWHLPLPHGVDGHGVAGHEANVFGACVQAPGWRVVTSRGDLVEVLPDRTYAVRKTNVAAVALPRGRLLTAERQRGEAYIEVLPPGPGASVKFPAPGRAVDVPAPVRVQLFHPPKQRVTGVFADLSSAKGIVTVRGVNAEAPVVFGYDSRAELGASIALPLEDGRWRVVRLRKEIDAADLAVPSDARVHGVVMVEPDDQPALLCVEGDGCTLALCTGKVMQRVVRAASRVVRVGVSPFSSHFAYEDAGGMVCVYSLRRQQVVLRLLTEFSEGSP
jgi:hypothetical protein